MKGESALWGVLMSGVGASFVIVAVALVIVSKQAADEAARNPTSAGIIASPEEGWMGLVTSAGAALTGADAKLPDGGAPDASAAPINTAAPDASAEEALTDAGAPEPDAGAQATAAATAPAKPKTPTVPKKPPVKPKPKKPR